MRVTNKMISNRYLTDSTTNLNNMQSIINQLTTGKSINRPSDNPYKVARSMQLNTKINANTQYNENIKDTLNWLDTTDEALGQAGNVLQRIRALMVSSGNAGYGSNERAAISDEINERIAELGQILNGNFDGKYVFGGTKTASKPLSIDQDINGNTVLSFADKEGNKILINDQGEPVDVNGQLLIGDDYNNAKNQLGMMNSKFSTEISSSVIMEYNVTVTDLLMVKDSNGNNIDVMKLMTDIARNLNSATDNEKVLDENLGDLDSVITNMLRFRSEVGAKQNRMESAQSKNEDDSYNMTDILSKTEDIDFAEKSIEFSTLQTVYQAALQVSAQILPKTLLDYL
ncbi:flagellar hook-associated protein FlgL [Clostridium sp. MSJ-8]|uniref:flagellar hook-associated protein FlgL n=1 Tax=Clostridium sp. MSJ-8 TaxID=2841510 RepID=UPI001C0EDCB8|nr:flagellar hook-associated protein FlgL [Clostridium sp. MSJ-8]MBU5488442.1 flagellar hook-associated protein FlgL [Clostridium sp. MSJ-8]